MWVFCVVCCRLIISEVLQCVLALQSFRKAEKLDFISHSSFFLELVEVLEDGLGGEVEDATTSEGKFYGS
jgi:hypothetical protein